MPNVSPATVSAEQLDAFAGACAFLSRALLRPPDQDLVDRLADPGLWEQWPLRGDEWTDRGVDLMRQALVDGAGESLDDLRRDHQRLLLGPGHVLASPYESVYLSEEHLIFEEQTLSVRRCYARFGLQSPMLNREPDDHIGLELDFLGQLCQLALDGLDAGHDDVVHVVEGAIGDFLREHLLLWVHGFLDRLETGAVTRFHRGLALLTRGAVQQLRTAFT